MLFIPTVTMSTPKKNILFCIKTLQVPVGLFTFRNRRALPLSSFLPASLTLEAALCLPLFLFFTAALIYPIGWLDSQRKIQTAVERTCEELSLADHREKLEGIEVSEPAIALTLRGIAGVYRKEALAAKAEMPDSGGSLCLSLSWREKIPYFTFLTRGVELRAFSRRRSWSGIDGKLRTERGPGTPDDGDYVYVGASMGRYHLYRDCHYLSNRFETVPASAIEKARNASGKIYRPCFRCVRSGTAVVEFYVTLEGEHYHSERTCSAMAAYVRKVPKREVEHLGLCSYCARRGGQP